MEVSEIKDSESFEAWLEDKPNEWAQVLAARIALRIAPITWAVAALPDEQLSKEHRENLTLLTFRACFISSAANKYPNDVAFFSIDKAAGVAYDIAIEIAINTTFDTAATDAAAYAATAAHAADATAHAADATARAADAAARAADAAASANILWEVIRGDCGWLMYDLGPTLDYPDEPVVQARMLSINPLWDVRPTIGDWEEENGPPTFLIKEFHKFQTSKLAQETNFGLITEWYQSVLNGSQSPLTPEAERKIALMANEDWGGDPVEVMDKIAAIAGWVRGDDGAVGDEVVGDGEEEEVTITEDLPKLNELPKQSSIGTPVSSFKNGPLIPLEDHLELGADPEQEALYAEVRNLLGNMKEHFPSQELQDCKGLLDDFLKQPDKLSDIEFVKILWLKGNAIRSKLARHDVVASEDMNYDQLPPAVAEALRAPVDAWNILVIGDAKLRELDAIRKGPKEFSDLKEEAEAAANVLNVAIQDRDIISEELAAIIQMQLEISDLAVANIHGDQALEVANASGQNVNGEILSGAYQTVLKVYKHLPVELKVAGAVLGAGAGAAMGADLWVTVKGSWAYVEFIALNPEVMKHYVSVAYGNPALERAVDFIKLIRDRYKS